ncbi:MAG: dynamin family protein [bacterium]
MLQKMISNFQKYMDDSPLNNVIWLNDNGKKVNLSESINNYQSELNILKDKLSKAMNVVVMGEVKAGKSTLLNAIIGKKIAPTDVLEATAAISELHYSEEEKAEIYRENKLVKSASIEDVYNELLDHQDDQEYFSGNIMVSIAYPLESLKEFHLVDTPGLSTITDANADKTRNFIQESDVVLWIFNANHIGQSDVNEELANVARMGKPIIAIINRIDEIDSSPLRVKNYINRTLGIYLEQVFTTSARDAFDARVNKDEEKLYNSGLGEVLDYLRNEIERNSEEIQQESIESSVKAVVRHYIKSHEIYINKINFISQKLKEYSRELEYKKSKIDDEVEMLILNKFEDELFLEEKRMIFKKIKDMRGLGNIFKQSKKEIVNYMKQEVNEGKVREWWSSVAVDVQKKLRNDWLEFSQELDNKLKNDFKKLAAQEKLLLNQMENNISDTEQSMITEIGQGAAIAGIGGIGMAAYVAGLGPAAAYVTFGAALSSFVPPLAIGGAIIIGAKKLANRNQELDNLKSEALSAISYVKTDIKRKWIDKDIIPAIKDENKRICDELRQKFVERMTVGLSIDKLSELSYDIKNHIEEASLVIEGDYKPLENLSINKNEVIINENTELEKTEETKIVDIAKNDIITEKQENKNIVHESTENELKDINAKNNGLIKEHSQDKGNDTEDILIEKNKDKNINRKVESKDENENYSKRNISGEKQKDFDFWDVDLDF